MHDASCSAMLRAAVDRTGQIFGPLPCRNASRARRRRHYRLGGGCLSWSGNASRIPPRSCVSGPPAARKVGRACLISTLRRGTMPPSSCCATGSPPGRTADAAAVKGCGCRKTRTSRPAAGDAALPLPHSPGQAYSTTYCGGCSASPRPSQPRVQPLCRVPPWFWTTADRCSTLTWRAVLRLPDGDLPL